jgi:hypothetical protein
MQTNTPMLGRFMTVLMAATVASGLLATDAQARGGGGGGGGGHGGGFGGGGHGGSFGGATWAASVAATSEASPVRNSAEVTSAASPARTSVAKSAEPTWAPSDGNFMALAVASRLATGTAVGAGIARPTIGSTHSNGRTPVIRINLLGNVLTWPILSRVAWRRVSDPTPGLSALNLNGTAQFRTGRSRPTPWRRGPRGECQIAQRKCCAIRWRFAKTSKGNQESP